MKIGWLQGDGHLMTLKTTMVPRITELERTRRQHLTKSWLRRRVKVLEPSLAFQLAHGLSPRSVTRLMGG